MLWKSVTGLIVLFWIVMTTMLVKQTYFPDESTAKTVPVNVVLARIAQHQAMAGGSDTMQLLHNREPAGDVSLGITQRPALADSKPGGFAWHSGGRVTGKAVGIDAATAASWSFEADQNDAQGFEHIRIAIHSTQTKNNISIEWKLGDEMPKIEVMQNDKLIMDTKAVLAEAQKQNPGAIGISAFKSMIPGFLGNQKLSLEHFIQMQAREEMIKVGDRKVRGATVTLSALGLLQSKLRITDGGEIAELELPNHWRALAMLVLGMDPEVNAR